MVKRNEGRIYGIVPETNNFAWEKYLDEDGVEREYACTDVLIFTSLYKEAGNHRRSNQWNFSNQPLNITEVIKGIKWAVFDDGYFLGLQALGDNVEPCFEGAAFYNLQSSIEQIMNKIKEYTLNYQSKGGKTEMPKINFKLSDDDKFSALWSLLNTEYNEESGWLVTYGIVGIYGEYAACSYETGDYERVYYTKDDEKDSVVINSKEKCFIVDVTEKKATLDTLRSLNGGSYELVSDVLTNAQENSNKVSEFSTKIEELDTSVSTLTTERDNSIAEHALAQEQITTLTEELGTLKEYKLGIETEQKEAILTEYENQLADEVLESYRKKLSEFTALDLDKELAYELKKKLIHLFLQRRLVRATFQRTTRKAGLTKSY